MTSTSEPAIRTAKAVWDGNSLLAAVTCAADVLRANQQRINDMNVFPVRDGDTGTNMALTMRSAIGEAEKLGPVEQAHASEVASRIARGALMGAKGNSGVILSQIFRGFATGVAGHVEIDGRDFARALAVARDMAYKAVINPVEGTMLTVIRVAAEHAERAAVQAIGIATVTAQTLHGAETALALTPELLDKLREAGVVDSGGQGLVYLLDGLDRFARGEHLTAEGPSFITAGNEFEDLVAETHAEEAFGYCTNFMIFGERIPFEHVRAELAAMGESAVIVGDDAVIKAHIHTDNPGRVLDYAIKFGELGQIQIDNMNQQMRALRDRRNSSRIASVDILTEPANVGEIAVVAFADGSGLAAAYRSMGATSVFHTVNGSTPGVEELLSAVDATASNQVILLPNNPTTLLAAGCLPELTNHRVVVVPSRSAPQGMAALEAFTDDASLEANVAAMTSAANVVRTIEVSRVDSDAQVNGTSVSQGGFVGLLNGVVVASGYDADEVALEAICLGCGEEAELITVFVGECGSPAESAALREIIESKCKGAEIQIYDGGQAHCRYIVAVE